MNQNKDVMVANAIIEAVVEKHSSCRTLFLTLAFDLERQKVVNEAEIENIDGVGAILLESNTRLFLERDLLIVCMLLWLEIRVLS